MEKRIEYAVADQHGVVQLVTNTDRERAFRMVARFNANPANEGDHFVVMNRTVTITDWTPANTGIVGPHQGGSPEG